jgi:hypothetical protein
MGIGFAELLVLLFFLVFVVAGTVVWIWSLVDCATKEADVGNQKVTWIIIIAITHIIGSILYMVIRRPQRLAELGR